MPFSITLQRESLQSESKVGQENKAQISLNEILQHALHKLQPQIKKAGAVTRCDLLPSITGNWDEMLGLFDGLIRAIVTQTPHGPKLYLYIECSGGADLIPASTAGNKSYLIQFKTNLQVDESWKSTHQKLFEDCLEILTRHNGKFELNNSNHTGCLFSLMIPGKLE